MLNVFFLLFLQLPSAEKYSAIFQPWIHAHKGQVSIALKHLSTGETYEYRAEERMPTASLIKVAVLAELYARVHEGKVQLTDIVQLRKEDKVPGAGILTDCFTEGVIFPIHDAARLMITLSDNTATNLVIDKLGVAEINERMAHWGFRQTRLNAKVYRGSTTSIDPEQTKKFGLGSTTARDMVQFFSELHAGQMVSPHASKEMLAILKLCHDDSMFRRFLPYEKVTAHKTGATNAVRTSAGILQTETGPVALCVLTAENQDQSWLPDNAGQVLIARIAEVVVHLNRKKPEKNQGSATSRLPILKEPLKVHPANPRYFSWNGRALAVVSSGEHYGAVVNLDFDYLKYLDTLQREGMHYTRIFTGAYIEPVGAFGIERNTLAPASERFIAPWKRSGTPGYAGGGNKFDIDQWDEAYLQRLKSFVQAAHERNIIVEVTLFCSTYTDKQWQLSPLHPQNSVDALEFMDWKKLHTEEVPPAIFQQQEKLVRYLVRELNTYPNIIWEIQNEPWSDNHSLGEMINPYLLEKKTFPNRVQITAPSSVSWQRRVARLIRDTEKTLPYQHIIAQNVANFRLAVDPTVDLADVDLVHFHYAYPEACQWNASLAKPICCDETGFAGSGDDAYRQQAWKFMLAGGGLWNHLDYSFSCGKEDGTDVQPKSPGGGSPQLRKELDVLSRFLNSFDLKNMKPDTSLLQNTNGVVGYCLAHPGHSYACYLTQRLPSSLLLNLPAGNYQIEWIEPRTGQSIARFKIQFPREVPIDVPKSRGDLALTIRRVP